MDVCMNEWMKEWMNEGMNEWMDVCMNEWIKEWMNEWRDQWMNEWTCEYFIAEMCLDNLSSGGGGGPSEKGDQLCFFDRLLLHSKFIQH